MLCVTVWSYYLSDKSVPIFSWSFRRTFFAERVAKSAPFKMSEKDKQKQNTSVLEFRGKDGHVYADLW